MIHVNSKWAVVVASSALLSLQAGAHAANINYTQTWQTTGTQATSNNTAFANYPGWTYYKHYSDGSNVRVSNAGELSMGVSPTYSGQYVTSLVTSQAIAGTSTFDLSTTPLTVSVDGGSRFFPNDKGTLSIGLVVGNVAFLVDPGSAAYHVKSSSLATTYLDSTLGFTPPTLASDPAPTDVFTHMSVSVVTVGTNDHFTYTIAAAGYGSYTNSIDIPVATVGNISSAGLLVTNHGGGYFRNFAVTQSAVPTPAALPAGFCLLWGMTAVRRRR